MKQFFNYKSHQIKNISISETGEMTARVTGADPWWEFDNEQDLPCYLEVEMSFSPSKDDDTEFHHCEHFEKPAWPYVSF